MEKDLTIALRSGASSLQVVLGDTELDKLGRFVDLLLSWNRKINLTAITDPAEVVERHLLDSLAAIPAVKRLGNVLDLGAGGGFPGIPLAIALPSVHFVLVDTVGKKVGFLKAAIAQLGLPNARALQARAKGDPAGEGIPTCDGAICRAFMAPAEWLALAQFYVEPGGTILTMLGAETELPGELPSDVEFLSVHHYRLPRSGAERRIGAYRRR